MNVLKEWFSGITRPQFEIASMAFILICALSVFTSRIPNQEVLELDQGKLHYTGSVVSKKMNGQGKLTFENGDVYEGQFQNGLFQGQGTYKSAKGWVYVGQFKQGYANGQGKLTTEGQVSYEGTFKQGIYQHAH